MSIKLHNHVQTHLDEYSGEMITTVGKPSVRDRLYGFKMYGKTVQSGTPTPESPVPIQSVPSSFDITSCGKNLFGLTDTDFTNGEVLGEGKKVTLKLKPNTEYTLSTDENLGTHTRTNIWFNGSSSTVNGVNSSTPRTSQTDSNGSLYVSIRNTEITRIFSTCWIQLEEGTTATPYTPYIGSTTPITLRDTEGNLHELCSLPNGTADEVNADSGKIIKRTHKINLSTQTFTRSFLAWDRGDYKTFNLIFHADNPIQPLRNSYINSILYTHSPTASAAASIEKASNVAFIYTESGVSYLVIKIDYKVLGITDWDALTNSQRVSAFNTWISNQGAEAIYTLDTPQIYDLHPDELAKLKQIKSVYPSTNIFTSASTQPTLACNIRKLGNRPFIESPIIDENGNFLVDENGNNIIGVT